MLSPRTMTKKNDCSSLYSKKKHCQVTKYLWNGLGRYFGHYCLQRSSVDRRLHQLKDSYLQIIQCLASCHMQLPLFDSCHNSIHPSTHTHFHGFLILSQLPRREAKALAEWQGVNCTGRFYL